jgi:hypothetical protein
MHGKFFRYLTSFLLELSFSFTADLRKGQENLKAQKDERQTYNKQILMANLPFKTRKGFKEFEKALEDESGVCDSMVSIIRSGLWVVWC